MGETQNIRVLLVEDDDEDAAIFCRYVRQLRGEEVAVERVAGEEEGRSRLSDGQFDLIFLDLNLGGPVSGIDLLKRLHSDGVDIPAIVVTGAGDQMKAVEAMKSGAYDYLIKDNLSADLLERTIRNVHKRHSLEQERARMMEKLAELTVTDELTGLANRRHLTRKLDEEVRRSGRAGHLFSLLMIDLDHFKRVNDQYGHQTGDEVLKKCAATLKRNLRSIDFVARYGGEEFCVVLLETRLPGARIVAERLRKAVKALPEPVPTVSIGIAQWQPHGSAQEMIRRADEALYSEKEAGRDRVVVQGE